MVVANSRVKRQARRLDPNTVRVCVVMPIRNEAGHIAGTLDSVLQQTFPRHRTEILVVDGLSDDHTLDILVRYQQNNPRLRVLSNPRGTAPTSLNMGIAASNAEIIVRVDGHCTLASDYIERCVELLGQSGAGNVGGLMLPSGDGIISSAVAVAMSSRFGIGNGRFRYLQREEYVDTVYLGCFRREVLDEVGWFDAELTRNQDDELNYRITQAGFGVLLSPAIVSTYVPRGSLAALWRQFYQFGLWKVRVIRKHPHSIQPRHLVPPVFVATLAASLLSFVLWRRRLFLLVPTLYGVVVLWAAAWGGRRDLRLTIPLLAVIPCLHLGYGSGFVIGLWHAVRGESSKHRVFDR